MAEEPEEKENDESAQEPEEEKEETKPVELTEEDALALVKFLKEKHPEIFSPPDEEAEEEGKEEEEEAPEEEAGEEENNNNDGEDEKGDESDSVIVVVEEEAEEENTGENEKILEESAADRRLQNWAKCSALSYSIFYGIGLMINIVMLVLDEGVFSEHNAFVSAIRLPLVVLSLILLVGVFQESTWLIMMWIICSIVLLINIPLIVALRPEGMRGLPSAFIWLGRYTPDYLLYPLLFILLLSYVFVLPLMVILIHRKLREVRVMPTS